MTTIASQATLGVLAPLFGGAVVAVVTYVVNRPHTGATIRKLDAEAEKTRAETAQILASANLRPLTTSQLPPPWRIAGSNPGDYDVSIDRAIAHEGGASAHVMAKPGATGFATILQSFNAKIYRCKRIRMSAYVRTINAAHAALWLRGDGAEDEMMTFDNMGERPIVGTNAWGQHAIVVEFPEATQTVFFGALLAGHGEIWVDDFQFEEVSEDVPLTDMVAGEPRLHGPSNLGFEAT